MPQAYGTDEKSTTHLVSLVSQIDPRATTLRKKNLKIIWNSCLIQISKCGVRCIKLPYLDYAYMFEWEYWDSEFNTIYETRLIDTSDICSILLQ